MALPARAAGQQAECAPEVLSANPRARRDALIQLSELCQKLKKEMRWEVGGGGRSGEEESTITASGDAASPVQMASINTLAAARQ